MQCRKLAATKWLGAAGVAVSQPLKHEQESEKEDKPADEETPKNRPIWPETYTPTTWRLS